MNWQSAIERTVTGLGYELVAAEKTAGGLLRVFIDHLADVTGGDAAERFINVDDCELVTRQLQHVLEVESVTYERLEVSSPGLDRPLRRAADYARFVGQQVEVTLKLPFQGRKKYSGELQAAGEGWRLVLADAGGKPARRLAAAAKAKPEQPPAADAGHALDFVFEEVREARLVPVVDFKGRRFTGPSKSAHLAEPGSVDVDGGRML